MAVIKNDTTVVAKETHVATTVEETTVLLNNETNLYQGLHGVGPRIWEEIQKPTTVDELVETISTEYDVDIQQCERDIRAFLQEMCEERLIEIDDSAAQ